MLSLLQKNKFFMKIIKIYEKNPSVWLYLIFGGLTTLINIVTYEMFTKVLNIDYMISNIIAWIISVIFAYITNKIYVFESKEIKLLVLLLEIGKFFTARLISLGIDVLIMYTAVGIMQFNDTLIKILSNIVVIVLNYFFSKYIIFRKKV